MESYKKYIYIYYIYIDNHIFIYIFNIYFGSD